MTTLEFQFVGDASTADNYALSSALVDAYNALNPNADTASGKKFIPFGSNNSTNEGVVTDWTTKVSILRLEIHWKCTALLPSSCLPHNLLVGVSPGPFKEQITTRVSGLAGIIGPLSERSISIIQPETPSVMHQTSIWPNVNFMPSSDQSQVPLRSTPNPSANPTVFPSSASAGNILQNDTSRLVPSLLPSISGTQSEITF